MKCSLQIPRSDVFDNAAHNHRADKKRNPRVPDFLRQHNYSKPATSVHRTNRSFQKTSVYKFVFDESTYINALTNPANHAVHDEH